MVAEFAQIVGLLAAFKSSRDAGKSSDMLEFLTWLSEHNHSDIKEQIENNQATSVGIKALLNTKLVDIESKLNLISEQLTALVSRTQGIEELASSYSTELISDQAYEILSLMNEHKTQFMLVAKASGASTTLVLSPGPNYQPHEVHFLESDLNTLVELGLLIFETTSKGNPRYRFTRAASKLFTKKR